MTILTMYTGNSDDSCRDIFTVAVLILLLIVLHVSGTNHDHPEYGLTSTQATVSQCGVP